MSYDYEDRITQITLPGSVTDTFTYNGLDTRATKDDSTGNYSFVRDGADVTDPVLDDGAASYTPGVSRHTSNGTVFDNLNYIGTSTRQTNSSQTTTATRTYDAFGNLFASTGTPVGPFGFVGDEGYQEDHDSGLKLLGYRYYDPTTGRFLTRDPAQDGRNWYAYCYSNATALVDADGQEPLHGKNKTGKAPDGHQNQQQLQPPPEAQQKKGWIRPKKGGGSKGYRGQGGQNKWSAPLFDPPWVFPPRTVPPWLNPNPPVEQITAGGIVIIIIIILLPKPLPGI
jgi:RHS repeat-associated protein